MSRAGLDTVYGLGSTEEAMDLYADWAATYDADLRGHGYVTPKRCAEALAAAVDDPSAPLVEFGCGTGLSGLALRAAGFTAIDGYDLSGEMLAEARGKGIYRVLSVLDLSGPLDAVPEEAYAHAAAIGVLNPAFMPPTVIDAMLGKIPVGGCLAFSINDNSARDGSMETRVLELCEYNVADLVYKDHGEHLPGKGLSATVYVLKKR